MLNRRAVALLISAAILLTALAFGASAETAADLSTAMPLIDLTVSSAVRVGDYPESVSENGYVSSAFTQNFFSAGAGMGVGITEDMAADTQKQADYMSKVFIPQAAELVPTEASAPERYIGLYVFHQSFDASTGIGVAVGNVYEAPAAVSTLTAEQIQDVEWLDVRMQVTVAIDNDSPAGWRILSFSWDSPDIIEAVESYITDNMLEYVNANAGYSIQYPAVFDENVTTEDENGLKGTLANGTASFSVRTESGKDGRTAQERAQALAEAHEGAVVTVNDITGLCRVTWKEPDGTTVMNLIIVSGESVYEAEMSYAPSLALDFSLYSEYMMNSFTADEIGVG